MVDSVSHHIIHVPDRIKSTIYLNILTVTVPVKHFCNGLSQKEPQAYGVALIIELPETQESGSENKDDKPGEPFL